ncbi:YheC/YheD family protein [Brevibacillus sp. B_LB10_24]|uniref:YheC/YheD family protein n=1 Tax=Brevibacillus sp. B_LB10_24 TaxID=3380645 RepID=UPI0038B705E5
MSFSKMKKYKCMLKSKRLVPHVPKTRWMTRSNLWDFTSKYGKVILKPLGGSRGSGVIQVSPLGDDRYEIHRENIRKILYGKDRTYRYVKDKIGSRKYIIQRRVPLATVDNRPFDIRVIVQRKKHSSTWKVTGIVAKVAGKGYIVTNNTRSKGKLLPVKTALKTSSVKGLSTETLLDNITKNAIRTAKSLRRIYPDHRIYGMDIGLDNSGHVWIIEANRKPLMSHFLKIKDRSMYRRIMAYKKS